MQMIRENVISPWIHVQNVTFWVLEEYYEIDLDSWMYAAAEKNLPIIVPR
jgi:hypothetical protein